MQEPDSQSPPVRPSGAGYCYETPELYVWEADARDASRSAVELLQPLRPTGARPVGR